MKNQERKGTRTRKVAAIVAMALVITGGVAAAHAMVTLPAGGVTIIGTRYFNGVPHAVKCTAGEGNVLDASNMGARVLELVAGPSCGVYLDTDDNDELIFSGPETFVVANGVKTTDIVFADNQVTGGPYGSDGAVGSMAGIFKCTSHCSSVKGPIVYHRYTPNYDEILFIGTYKAHF